MHEKSVQKPTVVVGEGWAALGVVGLLTVEQSPVVWITGTGAVITAPLPVFESMDSRSGGMNLWLELANRLGIECGPVDTGSFLREFRNKAFREAPWSGAGTPEMRREIQMETLWAPETRIAPTFEGRAALTLGEIEEAIRARLASTEYPLLRRIEGTPVIEVRTDGNALTSVLLGNGEEIACEQLVFADRWNAFNAIQGLPEQLRKQVTGIRKREPVGVLQALFTHADPIGAGLSEGFYGTLNKEAGEDQERRIWGYFSSDGKKSFWTVCLSSEEVEDNHQITKRLRRMKAALEKMFTGSPWLSSERTTFASNVSDEQVRMAESYLFSNGDYEKFQTEAAELAGKFPWALFMTDGFGVSAAMQQVSLWMTARGTKSQAENVDVLDAAVL